MKKIAAFLCSLLLLFAAGCQAAAAPDSPSEPDGQSELSSESGSVIDTADPDAVPQETARPDSPEETVIVREAHATAIRALSMASRISAPPKRKMGLPVEKAASSSAKATASGRVRRVFIA